MTLDLVTVEQILNLNAALFFFTPTAQQQPKFNHNAAAFPLISIFQTKDKLLFAQLSTSSVQSCGFKTALPDLVMAVGLFGKVPGVGFCREGTRVQFNHACSHVAG